MGANPRTPRRLVFAELRAAFRNDLQSVHG